MTYVVEGDMIASEIRGATFRDVTPICKMETAVEAYRRLQSGVLICENFGHDFTVHVSHNMWICFRCDEPGWEVPVV